MYISVSDVFELLNLWYCGPDHQKWPGSRKESRGATVENAQKSVANYSQTHRKLIVTGVIIWFSV